ncbi:YbjN domain-containing protein [Paraburkholderia sp.]|uniref:YbjN domain-containing protein n=1 Tax=Paraburkholderia sp. TaxID=1926495 RepID=UPI002638345E|nr:YbjN domain-containing protein [Paraburkholderia sp.]
MSDKDTNALKTNTAVALIETVEVDQLADILKASGYRVTPAEQNGRTQLMSASQGVGFAVRFGNAVPGTDAYIDYTLSCAVQVQGELPVDLVPSWNRTKRFARLSAQAQFLVLEMDVIVGGGVAERHLRSMTELWDRLIQEFLLHLRNRPAMAAAEQAAVLAPIVPEAHVESDRDAGADPVGATMQ